MGLEFASGKQSTTGLFGFKEVGESKKIEKYHFSLRYLSKH